MNILKRIYLIFMSIFIIFISVYQVSFVSCASGIEIVIGAEMYHYFHDLDRQGKQDYLIALMDNLISGGAFIASSLGAIVNGSDFDQFINNYQAYKDYILSGDIVDDVTISEDNSISFAPDLISLIKQALKEYASETNGYSIVSTQRADMASVSAFGDYYRYQTFRAFVKEYGIVAACRPNDLRIVTFPEYTSGEAGFYINRTYNNAYSVRPLNFKTWAYPSYSPYVSMWLGVEEVFHSLDEVIEKSPDYGNSLIYSDAISFDTISIQVPVNGTSISAYSSYFQIYSEDGRHIMVFLSKVALENYSVEHRTVYFGSGFYDETGKITVSYDELEDYLDGKYDDFLDDLRDIIGDSNLTEEEIEKIVDKLIGKIGEIDDSIGDVKDNLKETNSWLEKIYAVLTNIDNTVAGALSGLGFSFDTSTIEAYLDAILAQLGYISDQIDGMTAEEIDEKSDSLLDSLKSLFTDVGEAAKTKFPFSIPWDIHSLLTFLSGGGGSSGAAAQVSSYGYTVYSSGFLLEIYGRPGEGSDGNPDSGGHHVDKNFGGHQFGEMGAYRPGSFYLTDKGAPAFKIPLVIQSIGIEEDIVISMDNFGILSYVSRAIFTAIFAYALINMTIKVLGIGKELSL